MPFTYLQGNAECFTYEIMCSRLEKYALKSVSFMMKPLVDCSFQYYTLVTTETDLFLSPKCVIIGHC